MTAEKFRRGHAPVSCRLQMEDLDLTSGAGRHAEMRSLLRPGDDLPGDARTGCWVLVPYRLEDDQSLGLLSLPVPICVGRGPRLHGPDLVTNVAGMAQPVDLAVLLAQLRGFGRLS